MNADASRLLAVREDGLATVWDVRATRLVSPLERTPIVPPDSEGDRALERAQFELDTSGTRAFAHLTHSGTHGWNFEHEIRVWSVLTGRQESSRSILSSRFASRPSTDGALRAFLANGYYLDPGSVLHVEGAPLLTTALRRERARPLVHDVRWSEDGARLAVLRLVPSQNPDEQSTTSSLEIWDVASGRRLVEVPVAANGLVGFSHDGAIAAVGVWHMSTSVLDVATASWRLRRVRRHRRIVFRMHQVVGQERAELR